MTDLLTDLTRRGLAIWLDDLDRRAIADGTLARLMSERHVTGVTSNPTIFARSITGSSAYDGTLRDLRRRGAGVDEARRALTTWDVRAACDVLRPVFEATGGNDGMVSIEVDPRFAYDSEATVADARDLWWQVDRPNLLVKIPATKQGLAAITACLAEGISVNGTLIFSATRYGEVFEAFVVGMAKAAQRGHDLHRIASVASLFVSRVDTAVDHVLRSTHRFDELRGRAGLANARLAAQIFDQRVNRDDWLALADAGARPQKLLWASTGVKDPAYDDTRYVTGLALPGTINTMPLATLDAVANRPALTALEAYPDPAEELKAVHDAGVDLDGVMERLENDGVTTFAGAWAALGRTIAQRLDA
jgi:transaldolase